jgi:prepilin peptidase CpaA
MAVTAGALAWSAVSDVRLYEIPDAASILIVGGFVCFCVCVSGRAFLPGLAVGLGVFVMGLILFARGLMGGGDVKLLAATSLWCGPHLLAPFAMVTALTGVLLGVLMLSPLRRLMPPAPADAALTANAQQGLRQPMPYGVAIAAGGLWVLARQASGLA